MLSERSSRIGPPASKGEPPLDEFCRNDLFDVLGNQRRRYILWYLVRADEPRPCRDIAEQVAAWENDSTPEEVSSSQYQSVYNSFYQTHFPRLEEEGFIDYDRSEGIVYPREHLTELEPILQRRTSRFDRWRSDRKAPIVGGMLAVGTVTGSLYLQSVQVFLVVILASLVLCGAIAISVTTQ